MRRLNKMSDILGIGTLGTFKSDVIMVDCKMNVQNEMVRYGWVCRRTHCVFYSKCPFSW